VLVCLHSYTHLIIEDQTVGGERKARYSPQLSPFIGRTCPPQADFDSQAMLQECRGAEVLIV